MIDICIAASIDTVIAVGALISDYAGVMAVFLEGIINLGAFLCFTFSDFTGNVYLGSFLAVLSCVVIVLFIAIFIEKFSVQPFVAGLAINTFSIGFIALLSSALFNTKGTLSGLPQENIFFVARYGSTVVLYIIAIALVILLKKTQWGVHTQITGSDAEVLQCRGLNPKKYRVLSWCVASFLAALAGCVLTMRLQAYVPNISAGKGWLALVAVFLGKRKTLPTLFAVLFFASASYGANRMQALQLIPHTVLLAFPNIAALLLFILMPQQKKV